MSHFLSIFLMVTFLKPNVRSHDIQENDSQQNGIQKNEAQQNDIWKNDIKLIYTIYNDTRKKCIQLNDNCQKNIIRTAIDRTTLSRTTHNRNRMA